MGAGTSAATGPLAGVAPLAETVPPRPPRASARRDVLQSLGIDDRAYLLALGRATRNGSDAAAELIAAGLVDEAAYARACAERLGCRFEPVGPLDEIIGEDATRGGGPPARALRTCDRFLNPKLFCLPLLETLDELDQAMADDERLRGTVRVTARRDLADAQARRSAEGRLREARHGLSAERPEASARTVLFAGQSAALCTLAFALILAAALAPGALLVALHAALSLIFAACVALRLHVALRTPPGGRPPMPALPPLPSPVPIYSVLVPLRGEAEMVTGLVAVLDAIDWPKTRLDIKLVCEADDPLTVEAVSRAIAGRAHMELVVAPVSLPRTKPKALNYALPLARGTFVTIFDAEDWPHPAQLRAAYHAFAEGPSNLGCVQAPLAIANGARSWLSGFFALEYAALFRGLLPYLAERGLPIPLGGTSNHFSCAALEAVGGWDSHNVTEDADLGLRLARAGYAIGVVEPPTLEDAPERWRVWRNQRTRWMKGWMQSLLVHLRSPSMLLAELGSLRAGAFVLLFIGMILSALAQPLFLLAVAVTSVRLHAGVTLDPVHQVLFLLDALNLVGAPLAFGVLAWRVTAGAERLAFRRRIVALPLYWLLVGYATLRALRQLLVEPHRWEKTPHGAESRRPSVEGPLHELGGAQIGWRNNAAEIAR